MKVSKYKFFCFVNIMILFNSFNSYYLAQPKQNSIIKYSEEIANETCECYYEEFTQTASHQDAITKCKLETKENLNHNKKI